jgi:hypothetical protein
MENMSSLSASEPIADGLFGDSETESTTRTATVQEDTGEPATFSLDIDAGEMSTAEDNSSPSTDNIEYSSNDQSTEIDPEVLLETAAENFGQSLGEELGRAIGDVIREDPQARRFAVGAAGVGAGAALLILLMDP